MATTINAPSAPTRVLGDLARFLARPQVMQPSGLRGSSAWAQLGILAVLHVAAMLLVILPLISWWQRAFGLPLPDAFDKLPSGWLLPVTLLVAPVLEEAVFRGWQTGRPRALWLLGCAIALAALAAIAGRLSPVAVAACLIGLVTVAAGGWLRLRRRQDTPAAYVAAFPVIFWIAAFAFAGMHLVNYPALSTTMAPMVLPQLWAGVLLGFTRQKIGLPASMLQHAAANCAVMMLTQIGG